jgi:effector-binding domain-containing protein
MEYRFRIKDVSPQRIVVRAARATATEWASTLEWLLADVWRYLNTFESVTVGPAMACLHETDDGQFEIAAGFPIAEPVEVVDEYALVEMTAGQAGTTLLEGPYERLPEAHSALHAWLTNQSHALTGDPWLIFWVTPDDVDLPSELRTELIWPLA